MDIYAWSKLMIFYAVWVQFSFLLGFLHLLVVFGKHLHVPLFKGHILSSNVFDQVLFFFLRSLLVYFTVELCTQCWHHIFKKAYKCQVVSYAAFLYSQTWKLAVLRSFWHGHMILHLTVSCISASRYSNP